MSMAPPSMYPPQQPTAPPVAAPTQPAAGVPQQYATIAQALSRGEFPHENNWSIVGQIYPQQNMPHGFMFTPNNKGGIFKCRVKLRKLRNNAPPQIAYVQCVAWGPVGQHLSQQLQPGMIVAVEGWYRDNRFQNKQTGQWVNSTQLNIKINNDGSPALWVLGQMQIIQETNQTATGQFPPQQPQQPPPGQYPPPQAPPAQTGYAPPGYSPHQYPPPQAPQPQGHPPQAAYGPSGYPPPQATYQPQQPQPQPQPQAQPPAYAALPGYPAQGAAPVAAQPPYAQAPPAVQPAPPGSPTAPPPGAPDGGGYAPPPQGTAPPAQPPPTAQAPVPPTSLPPGAAAPGQPNVQGTAPNAADTGNQAGPGDCPF